jgi:hypothetical protein
MAKTPEKHKAASPKPPQKTNSDYCSAEVGLVFNTEKSHLLAGKVVMTTHFVFGTTRLLGLGGGWIYG